MRLKFRSFLTPVGFTSPTNRLLERRFTFLDMFNLNFLFLLLLFHLSYLGLMLLVSHIALICLCLSFLFYCNICRNLFFLLLFYFALSTFYKYYWPCFVFWFVISFGRNPFISRAHLVSSIWIILHKGSINSTFGPLVSRN